MSKKKLAPCKACGAEIAASAKSCPHCGAKSKKPFYKKPWLWILLVFVFLIALGGEDEGESLTQDPTATVAAQNTPDSNTLIQSVYKVGDTLESNGMRVVYMSSGEYISDNEFTQPAQGNKYIFLQFAFENTSSSDRTVSMYNFECYADGYNASMKYFSEEELSATLSAGRSTSGYLYFEVPADAKEIEVEYTENVFSNKKITFVYEGDFNSGYVLSGNSTATENAFEVGEIAESKQLRITYLACYEDSSNNSFIVAKDGCHYVTCEFEFENLSDTDQSISYFSFDCYADGISCSGAYFRDDSLSATLSAGRKAKGTVTFEVPDNASVVEVEYLSNFWTSNRVVFTVNPQ